MLQKQESFVWISMQSEIGSQRQPIIDLYMVLFIIDVLINDFILQLHRSSKLIVFDWIELIEIGV